MKFIKKIYFYSKQFLFTQDLYKYLKNQFSAIETSFEDADYIFKEVDSSILPDNIFNKNKKIIVYSSENMDNKVIFANAICKLNIKFFNKYYGYIPKFLLNITIWKPYKKYKKLLDQENVFFISTNKTKTKNTVVTPYFIQLYPNYYKTLKGPKNHSKDSKKKFCAFIVSNPSNLERLDFFKKLSSYKKIDSYGKIFKNSNIYDSKRCISNPEIYKNYKFVICFENSYAEDYVTEKLPNVMLGNSIPIYKGAPNISEYFNTESFINFDDYGSFEKIIEKIIELDNDDKKYLKMLNRPWLTEENIKNIGKKELELENFFKNIFKDQ